eukprot:26537-Eustigmatos_ZCMA.PRE.1
MPAGARVHRRKRICDGSLSGAILDRDHGTNQLHHLRSIRRCCGGHREFPPLAQGSKVNVVPRVGDDSQCKLELVGHVGFVL